MNTSVDIRLQPLAVDVIVPPQEALDAGAPPEALLSFTAAMVLPFQDPNTGGPVVAPLATVSFKLNKEAMETIAERLSAESENLPKQSDIAVAGSMADVENLAENLGKFKNGQGNG